MYCLKVFATEGGLGSDLPGLLERLRISLSQMAVDRDSGKISNAPEFSLRGWLGAGAAVCWE